MSTTSDPVRPTVPLNGPRRAPDTDVEVLARRALGMAMHALYDGGAASGLVVGQPALAARARALLERHVPDGPELALALELLDEAATAIDVPSRASDRTST